MERRRLLLGGGALLAGIVPGCAGGDSGETPTPTEETTPTEVEVTIEGSFPETETPSPTPTATATPADTPTASPTPTAAGITHDINTRFTVGDSGEAIGYRIVEYARTDRLGNQASLEEANGTFLVVVLEVTNPQDELIVLPRNEFRVRSPQTWHKYDTDGSVKIDSDSRIDRRSLVNASIRSGSSRTGAVAFDVDPDSSYRVWIFPTGDEDTPEHFVPVGDISAVPRL